MKKQTPIAAIISALFIIIILLPKSLLGQTNGFNCRIALVYTDEDSLVYSQDKYTPDNQNDTKKLPIIKNKIKFVCSADFVLTEDKTVEYSFRLEGRDNQYTPWSTLREITYYNLENGNYVFKARARISNSQVSQADEISFTVMNPTKNYIFIIFSTIIVLLILLVIILKLKNTKSQAKLTSIEKELKTQNEVLDSTKTQLEVQQKNFNNTLHDLTTLSQAGQKIIKSLTLGNLSKIASEEIKNFFSVDDIGIGVYNAPHSSIDFSSFVLNGVTMAFARYNLDNKNNMIVWSFLNHRPTVLGDYEKEIKKYVDTQKFKIDSTVSGSAVYVPLYDNDMAIGVLTVKSRQKNYFTPYHLGIIHNLATYVEYAIVNITCMRKIGSQKKLLEERNVLLQTANSNLKSKQKELEKLNQELNKFSISVRNTENSVMMVDENKNISWVNYGFTKIYGYTFEEYISAGADYKTALKNPAAIEYFDKVYQDCQPITFTLLHYTKTNKEVWIQSSITPIADNEGNVVQLIVVETDITSVKRAEEEIRMQKNEIAQKSKEVTKSIEYASVIQSALMTGKTLLKECFNKSFFLNLPKAIVSGDFFWMGQKFGRKYLALCDCAGHGVPGAFLSLMGKMFLDEILQSAEVDDMPADLIRQLNDKLYESISSLSNKVGGIDGMDLSFCIINYRNTKVKYAGAYRPLYIIRNGEINTLQPDRCSLGNLKPGSDFKFNNSEFELQNDDFLLMTSDGYADQFGYENGKKMGRKNFAKLITEASQLESDKMSDFFLDKHLQWRGALEQVDDISIVGIVIEHN